jgi:hypothetical protein
MSINYNIEKCAICNKPIDADSSIIINKDNKDILVCFDCYLKEEE